MSNRPWMDPLENRDPRNAGLVRCARIIRHGLLALIGVTVAMASVPPLHAQTDDDPIVKLVAEPAELTMRVGDEVEVKITGVTRSGAQVDAPPVRLVGPFTAVRVREGVVTALAAGDHVLIATLV